jgi:hypothetical protein
VLRCWDWLDFVLVPLVLAALVADHAARGDVRFVVVTIAALAFGVVGIDHHGLMRPVEALLR